MNDNRGGMRLYNEFTDFVVFQMCENRSGKYNKIDDVYGWKHARALGWIAKPAEIFRDKKASGLNLGLVSSDGIKVELYCPECAKELLNKLKNNKRSQQGI